MEDSEQTTTTTTTKTTKNVVKDDSSDGEEDGVIQRFSKEDGETFQFLPLEMEELKKREDAERKAKRPKKERIDPETRKKMKKFIKSDAKPEIYEVK